MLPAYAEVVTARILLPQFQSWPTPEDMKIAQRLVVRRSIGHIGKPSSRPLRSDRTPAVTFFPAPWDESLSYFQIPWRHSGSLRIRAANGSGALSSFASSPTHYWSSAARIPKKPMGEPPTCRTAFISMHREAVNSPRDP